MTSEVLPVVDAAVDQTRARRNAALRRVLVPKSIALVGLSDNSGFRSLIEPTFDSDAEVFMVNPRYPTVLGRPTSPTLTSLDRPIDVVVSFMSAERTVDLVEEAAGLDVGGLVLMAGGFAETSDDGMGLQKRMHDAAERSGLEIVGPNGLGYINVPHRVSLTIASRHKRRPGGISIVSQSGAMLSGIAMAAWQYEGVGLNVLISAGNEAITDLAAYIDYLVEDPETKSIGLVIEKIRRPEAFMAAVRRATEAGKPVAAMKLARSARTQAMAASHTGSLTGDAWVYDVALRQAGVELAYDPEELVDRLALLTQIEPSRWSPVKNLAVVTMTGGFASLSADLAAAEGIDVPTLDSFGPWVRETLPGITVPNPLDTTGLGAALWPEIIERYATSDEVDALMVIHPVADEDENQGGPVVTELQRVADMINKPTVLANCSGVPGAWTKVGSGSTLASGRGLRPTLRGLASLGRFAEYRERVLSRGPAAEVKPIARPDITPIQVAEGPMLPFGATMDLLAGLGIPMAPYQLITTEEALDSITVGFSGPWVVKLADVAHRTEHNAVKLNITPDTLGATVTALRELAVTDDLPGVVAVQPMVKIVGEAFIGLQGASELGPLAVFGLGGVLVEAINRVGGRMAPFDEAEAVSLIEEFRDIKIMHGFRGRPGWDLDALTQLLVTVGDLAASAADWLGSLDINPLVWTGDGFQAVDALLIMRP